MPLNLVRASIFILTKRRILIKKLVTIYYELYTNYILTIYGGDQKVRLCFPNIEIRGTGME
jgi:hypothetical protein